MQAQIAGRTTSTNLTVSESTQIASGWSVKKTLLGKTVYDDVGQKIGTVQDLIVSPDKSVFDVIVGAGGFGAWGGTTKDMLKSLPGFDYANHTTERSQFVAAAERDIAKGKTKVADFEKKTDAMLTDVKGKMDQQLTALRVDVKAAETRLTEMKQAASNRWKDFEAAVSAATARLRKAVDVATG